MCFQYSLSFKWFCACTGSGGGLVESRWPVHKPCRADLFVCVCMCVRVCVCFFLHPCTAQCSCLFSIILVWLWHSWTTGRCPGSQSLSTVKPPDSKPWSQEHMQSESFLSISFHDLHLDAKLFDHH